MPSTQFDKKKLPVRSARSLWVYLSEITRKTHRTPPRRWFRGERSTFASPSASWCLRSNSIARLTRPTVLCSQGSSSIKHNWELFSKFIFHQLQLGDGISSTSVSSFTKFIHFSDHSCHKCWARSWPSAQREPRLRHTHKQARNCTLRSENCRSYDANGAKSTLHQRKLNLKFALRQQQQPRVSVFVFAANKSATRRRQNSCDRRDVTRK